MIVNTVHNSVRGYGVGRWGAACHRPHGSDGHVGIKPQGAICRSRSQCISAFGRRAHKVLDASVHHWRGQNLDRNRGNRRERGLILEDSAYDTAEYVPGDVQNGEALLRDRCGVASALFESIGWMNRASGSERQAGANPLSSSGLHAINPVTRVHSPVAQW